MACAVRSTEAEIMSINQSNCVYVCVVTNVLSVHRGVRVSPRGSVRVCLCVGFTGRSARSLSDSDFSIPILNATLIITLIIAHTH